MILQGLIFSHIRTNFVIGLTGVISLSLCLMSLQILLCLLPYWVIMLLCIWDS